VAELDERPVMQETMEAQIDDGSTHMSQFGDGKASRCWHRRPTNSSRFESLRPAMGNRFRHSSSTKAL